MSQSLAQIYLHIVFSTKLRQPLRRDPGLRESAHAFIAGVCRNLACPPLVVGGIEDHVHALCRLSKNVAPKDLLQEMKRSSSVWANHQGGALAGFHWQAGYGAFSVGPAEVDAVVSHIRTQEEHHRTETFQDEFRRLLREHGVEWDERYVWD
jgi:REP element-mobilizing transposase RayT